MQWTSGRISAIRDAGLSPEKMTTKSTGCESGEELGPLGRRHDRPSRTLEPGDRGVVVDGHDEHVALGARGLEVAQMADMQQVEMTVGESQSAARRLEASCFDGELLRRQDATHVISRRGRGSAAMAAWSSAAETVAVPIFITTTPPA